MKWFRTRSPISPDHEFRQGPGRSETGSGKVGQAVELKRREWIHLRQAWATFDRADSFTFVAVAANTEPAAARRCVASQQGAHRCRQPRLRIAARRGPCGIWLAPHVAGQFAEGRQQDDARHERVGACRCDLRRFEPRAGVRYSSMASLKNWK